MILYIWRGASEAHACGVGVALIVHVISLLKGFRFSKYKCFRFLGQNPTIFQQRLPETVLQSGQCWFFLDSEPSLASCRPHKVTSEVHRKAATALDGGNKQS